MNVAERKKPKSVSVDVRLPIPVLAFYEGVAAYAGMSVEETLRVALAMEMCKRGARPTSGDAHG